MSTLTARICACTPHSADCERIISVNNSLKTNKRASLTISTENCYLYTHFNMPPLENWDVRPAVDEFLLETDRRNSKRTVETKVTTDQAWFRHIFEHTVDDTEGEDDHKVMKFTF